MQWSAFIMCGNRRVVVRCRDASGRVTSLEGELRLEDTDYKNTQKLTWLAETNHAPFTPTVCMTFDHLISKGVLKPDEDFKDFVNKESKVRVHRWEASDKDVSNCRWHMRC